MKDDIRRRELEHLMQAPAPYKRINIVKMEMVKEGMSLYGMGQFRNPKVAAETVYPLVERADREMVLVMSLDIQMMPVALEVVSVGNVDCCILDMKNIFKHAILCNASHLICFHNHPSGNAQPSAEDRRVTERIKKCGELLGIQLADHIILGWEGTYYSFHAEEGWNDSEKGERAA